MKGVAFFCSILMLAAALPGCASRSATAMPSEAPAPTEKPAAQAPVEPGPPTGGAPAVNAPISSETIEIKDKMFVAQTNDIYFNPEDYLGKTIKYQGIFTAYESPETDTSYYSVIRYGPGCCGSDLNAGFEVNWGNAYPEADDWVEAVGVLEEYEENGYKYLRLALSSLEVMDERGEEYVSQ